MQSFTEDRSFLGCSDCKHKFDSASSLLQHFAQHVSQETKRNQVTFGCMQHTRLVDQWKNVATANTQSKKKKTETILEKVLKRNSLRQLSINAFMAGNKDNVLLNASSSSSTSLLENCDANTCLANNKQVLDTEDSSIVEEKPSAIPLAQLRQSIKERNELQPTSKSLISGAAPFGDIQLVKCDFQKRLENCIVKLVSKQISESIHTSGNIIASGNKSTSLDNSGESFIPNTNYRKLNANDDYNGMSEKFNPMNFCIITLNEGKSQCESIGSNIKPECIKKEPVKVLRGASNRKQQSPKRVCYQQNGKITNFAMKKNAELKVTIVAGCDDKVSALPPSKKKYLCNFCSKAFGWSTDLKRHILTHTGERPFKCNKCLATFTRNFLLQKHQVKIHRCSYSKQSTISPPNMKNNVEEYPLKKGMNKDVLKFCNEKYCEAKNNVMT